MKNEVLKKIAKLIDLKSIMTIIMILALVVGWFADKVTSEQFVPMVMMIRVIRKVVILMNSKELVLTEEMELELSNGKGDEVDE